MGKKSRESRRAAEAARRQQVSRPTGRASALGDHVEPVVSVKGTGSDARAVGGNNRWDALETLRRTAELERSVQARRDRHVRAARRAGATWVEIGRLLRVTPQAVQKRYGRTSDGA